MLLIVLIDGFLSRKADIYRFLRGWVSPCACRIRLAKTLTCVCVGGSPRAPWVRIYDVRRASCVGLSLWKLENALVLGCRPERRAWIVALRIPHSREAFLIGRPFAIALRASWRSFFGI